MCDSFRARAASSRFRRRNLTRWRRDGKELYYIAPGGRMMVVPITTRGTTIEPGMPIPLFQTHIFGGGVSIITGPEFNGPQYGVTHDGRFLINTVLDDASAPITLLQNWKPPAK